MNRLDGKVAVITGATGGIGLAAARCFLAEGASVWLADLDAGALAHQAAALAAELGVAATRIGHSAGDVSDEAATAALVAAVLAQHGRIDVAFLNAGTEGRVAPITETTVADFDRVLAVNVRGVFLGLKHVLPVMQRQGAGSVVITSSVAGLRGANRLAPYAASKHAVVGLMKSAVLELADSGVRVNTIHPSPIETRMMRALEAGLAPGAADAAKARITTRIPLARYGTADEVAQLALFLASDESRFITGGSHGIDGGMLAG